MEPSVRLYGIRNCDTVKKARAWLDAHDHPYIWHDFKTDGVEKHILEQWISQLGWESILNRSGTTFRKLPDSDKINITAEKAVALMLAQPSMIKRPILNCDGVIIAGFSPATYVATFAQ